MHCYKLLLAMGCTYIPQVPEQFANIETQNHKVLRQIMELPDGLRKEIRLLAKQYELLEFYKEPDDFFGEHIVRAQPYILKYRHYNTTEEFEWRIEPERLYA